MAFSSPEARADRVSALNFLMTANAGIVVVPVAGLRKYLPTKETWQNAQLHWEIGTEVEPEILAQRLVLMGYERQSMVGKPGEFSIRGSIVDVYPLNAEYPVRVELFDVEIDSIRYFEADTQRSLENLEEVTISPMTDLVFSKADMNHGMMRLQDALEKRLATAKDQTETDF